MYQQTTQHSAFEGRITFFCRHVSRHTAFLARHMNQSILEMNDAEAQLWIKIIREDDGYHPIDISELVTLLTSTSDIAFAFQGDEGVPLKEFKSFWEEYCSLLPTSPEAMRLALEWYVNTSEDIRYAWIRAINKAIQPIRKPEQLPGIELTESEKEELKDKDSPLVSDGGNFAPSNAK